jgi:hypothetical protein
VTWSAGHQLGISIRRNLIPVRKSRPNPAMFKVSPDIHERAGPLIIGAQRHDT